MSNLKIGLYLFGLGMLLNSCAEQGTYRLHIEFPDEIARAEVKEVEVWAVRGQEDVCSEYLSGALSPDQMGSVVSHPPVFGNPPLNNPVLPAVPAGRVLFSAEGRTGDAGILLRGCSMIDVQGGKSVEVTIPLQWAVDCHLLDGPCVAGAFNPEAWGCEQKNASDGEECDDLQNCTEEDACQSGVCVGKPRDCWNGDDCFVSYCDEGQERNQCVNRLRSRPNAEGIDLGNCGDNADNDCDGWMDTEDPDCKACVSAGDCDDKNDCTTDDCILEKCVHALLEETNCDDGLFCSVDGHCVGGICVSAPMDCSSRADACHFAVCSESRKDCLVIEREQGSKCDDGFYCVQNERCQQGVCQGEILACNDLNTCSRDACNEDFDRCEYTPLSYPGKEKPEEGTCENGMDDDCDGNTDMEDPDCQPCVENKDCDDGNPCTGHLCRDGVCQTSFTDGVSCNDQNFCTVKDLCASGVCGGQPRDCTAEKCTPDNALVCHCYRYICNEETDSCDPFPKAPGEIEDLKVEGPMGDPSCSDLMDNDCDGLTDKAEVECSRLCSKSNWCWENPLPQGDSLYRVVAVSPDDVWAAGGLGGTVIHWDGTSWSSVLSEYMTRSFTDFWVADANNVWITGDDVPGIARLHRSQPGGPWTVTQYWEGRYARSLWVNAPDNIWAVCYDFLEHWNGSAWTKEQPTAQHLTQVWGNDKDNVWAVGVAGTVVHWTGPGTWTVENPTTQALRHVWGSSKDDVWTVGDAGIALHWTGASWSSTDCKTTKTLYRVWGLAADDVWAVGDGGTLRHWTGVEWVPVDSKTTVVLRQVWGSSSDNLWAIGDAGTILHWNGIEWSKEDSKTTLPIYSLSGTGADDVWAVGAHGLILRRGNGVWTELSSGTRKVFRGVWGSAEEDVWVVGDTGAILHWDGKSLSPSPSPVSLTLDGIWGSSADDVWAVSQGGAILHKSGATEWEQAESGSAFALKSVYGTGPDSVFAAGYSGWVWRYTAGNWSQIGSNLFPRWFDGIGIWAAAPNDVWVVGVGGIIQHWDGSLWTSSTSGTTKDLRSIWGSGPDDIWVTCTSGTWGDFLHQDGSGSWSVTPGYDPNFFAIWGTAQNDVWAVGKEGVVWQFNGSAWARQESGCSSQTLYGVWTAADGDVWAVGSGGAILRKRRP
jgi:hypothetical protein